MKTLKTPPPEPKGEKVKKTLSILSLLFLLACDRQAEFVRVPLMVRDDQNKVCSEYVLTDAKKIKYELKAEYAIEKCDNLMGFTPHDFKQVQNWIRDEIEQQKKEKQVTP
jgi:hypothetical protein